MHVLHNAGSAVWLRWWLVLIGTTSIVSSASSCFTSRLLRPGECVSLVLQLPQLPWRVTPWPVTSSCCQCAQGATSSYPHTLLLLYCPGAWAVRAVAIPFARTALLGAWITASEHHAALCAGQCVAAAAAAAAAFSCCCSVYYSPRHPHPPHGAPQQHTTQCQVG